MGESVCNASLPSVPPGICPSHDASGLRPDSDRHFGVRRSPRAAEADRADWEEEGKYFEALTNTK